MSDTKDSYPKTKAPKDHFHKDKALKDVVPWDEDAKDQPHIFLIGIDVYNYSISCTSVNLQL